MFLRFTKGRRRKFLAQMIVWSVGMLVVVPFCMIVFPYLIDMPFDRYGSSPLDMFKQGGAKLIVTIWLIGFLAAFLGHLLNPLRKDEIQLIEKKKQDSDDHSNSIHPTDACG